MWPVVTPAVRDSHYQLYIPDPWGQWGGEKVEKSGKQARGESSKSKSKKKMKKKMKVKQSKAKAKARKKMKRKK
jgi:hypothetical protein